MFRYNFDASHSNLDPHMDRFGSSYKNLDRNIQNIRADISGVDAALLCPLDSDPRTVVYSDYTASGRSLRSIESFIQSTVIP